MNKIRLPSTKEDILGEMVKGSQGTLFKSIDGRFFTATPAGSRDSTGESPFRTWKEMDFIFDKKAKIFLEDESAYSLACKRVDIRPNHIRKKSSSRVWTQ